MIGKNGETVADDRDAVMARAEAAAVAFADRVRPDVGPTLTLSEGLAFAFLALREIDRTLQHLVDAVDKLAPTPPRGPAMMIR